MLSRGVFRDTIDSSEHKTLVAFHFDSTSVTVHLNLLLHASELCPFYSRPFAVNFTSNVSYLAFTRQNTKYHIDHIFYYVT